MYRCGVCSQVSRPGQTMRRHTLYRPDGQIERELPVCGACAEALEIVPLNRLLRQYAARQEYLSNHERSSE